jgi:addiction module RelE/StbE family toxin
MRLRWTEPATRDFTTICDYIEENSGPRASHKVAVQIYESIEKLARFPYSGRIGRMAGTRELVFSGLPFLAVYRMLGDAIEINRILHGAQKWP